MITFPQILCGSLQMDLTFYSLVLPLNLTVVSGIPLVIMMLWAICKLITMQDLTSYPFYIFDHPNKFEACMFEIQYSHHAMNFFSMCPVIQNHHAHSKLKKVIEACDFFSMCLYCC